jgi:hypothetical protein
MAMTVKEAVAIAGALGHPSKMPGYSYGISAQKCITGSQLRKVPGSVCASCYALTDWYRSWKPLLEGHKRRYEGLFHPRWCDAMVRMILSAYSDITDERDRVFRWHDSGDLQGRWHFEKIVEVCERTPSITHWLPTREYQIVAAFLATGKSLPGNLTVRLSAHMIDTEPVIPPAFAAMLKDMPVSTVSSVPLTGMDIQIVEGKGSVECRAVAVRENKCGNCRACWDPRVRSVNYPAH